MVAREARISWEFIRYDASSTVAPALLFTVAAWAHPARPAGGLLPVLGRAALYFWLYVYTFCLSNQLDGVEEDRINKPDRPLVTGLSSLRGARLRWVASMAAFTLAGAWFGVLGWTLLWQLTLTAYNQGGWAKHWLTKDLCMGLGVVAQLAAAWRMVSPITPVAWRWILSLAGFVFVLIPLQDVRDLEGDRATGRRTLPLALGEGATRVLLGLGFGILPLLVHFVMVAPAGRGPAALACDAASGGVSLLIAARILLLRNARADHRTYLLFTGWYCVTLGSAIAVL